jgi:hypothetical protein
MPDGPRPNGPRYEDDFYAWTQYQAEVLRTTPTSDDRFDREHVAEEIEALGRAQLHDVFGLVRRILTSFLLIGHGPADRSRYGWMYEIVGARAELEDRMSPTIWALTQAELPRLYRGTREIAKLKLAEMGAFEAAQALPLRPPYSLDDACTDDWYPDPPGEAK